MDLCHLITGVIILWYNGSYTMMAKPITALDLHYPMIQFLMKINVYTCTSVQWIADKNLLQLETLLLQRERNWRTQKKAINTMWQKMPRCNNKSTPKHLWLASLEKKEMKFMPHCITAVNSHRDNIVEYYTFRSYSGRFACQLFKSDDVLITKCCLRLYDSAYYGIMNCW